MLTWGCVVAQDRGWAEAARRPRPDQPDLTRRPSAIRGPIADRAARQRAHRSEHQRRDLRRRRAPCAAPAKAVANASPLSAGRPPSPRRLGPPAPRIPCGTVVPRQDRRAPVHRCRRPPGLCRPFPPRTARAVGLLHRSRDSPGVRTNSGVIGQPWAPTRSTAWPPQPRDQPRRCAAVAWSQRRHNKAAHRSRASSWRR
jgi:hypothetical protein